MPDTTITLRDTPAGGVIVYTTQHKPTLIGQRLTPAEALALDLITQASHRAEVVHMQVITHPGADATAPGPAAEDTHTMALPLEDQP